MRGITIVFIHTFLLVIAAIVPARAAVILNEALANEPGSATTLEWVEVFNWPDTGQPISLSGFKYTDGGQTTTIDTNILIPAGGFAILARKSIGTSSFEERWGNSSGVWGDHASESYPLIGLSQMSLRNSSDTIRLVSPTDDTSIILWLSDSGDSISVERIRPGANDAPSNFAVCKTSIGSTPGAENSVLPPRGDLAIDTVVIGPANPVANQPVQFAVRVVNLGFGDVAGGSVTMVQDVEPQAPIATESFGTVPEGGEVSVVMVWNSPRPGLTGLRLALETDPDSSNNFYALQLVTRFDKPYLIVSEYLANPDPGGPEEWIEIANVSNGPINLSQLRIGDSLNAELIPGSASRIEAGSFYVLAENESAFRSFYPSFSGPLIQIPGWRALNNTGDGIRLIGPYGEIIDSLTFRTTYPGNHSIERVELSSTFAAPGDWAECEDGAGATPGLPNSVQRGTPGSLILDSIWLVPSVPNWGESIRIYASVSNRSFGPATNWSITAARDLNFSSPGSSLEAIAESVIPTTDEEEFQVIDVSWENAVPGIYRIHVALRDESGELTQTSAVVTTVRFSQPLLIVSEYVAAPSLSGPGEWIELYNASDIALSLQEIRIGDSAGLGSIPTPTPVMLPGSFLVVAQDESRFRSYYGNFDGEIRSLSTWQTLNDSRDQIRIVGAADEIIDSLTFSITVSQSRSSERRQLLPSHANPEDWGLSIDPFGATPGRANSIKRFNNDLAVFTVTLDSAVFPWPTPITGVVFIANEGFSTVDGATIGVRNIQTGSLIAELSSPQGLSPGESEAVPFSLSGLSPGRYLLRFELEADENSTNNEEGATAYVAHSNPSILITEYLANPGTSGPGEWVEIYNAFEAPLSLYGMSLGDSVSYSYLFVGQEVLQSGEYAVICQSPSTFRVWYPDFDGNLYEATVWRDLNNDGDKIRLRGVATEIVDSLTYSNTFGDNRSSERTTLLSAFSTPGDWAISVDPSGATPGRPNSVSASAAGSLQVEISPNPVFRSAGERARIDYRLKIGESLTLKIYDRAGRLVRTIADAVPSATGFVEWNGTDDAGYSLHPGPYVLLARSEPAGSMKKMVVVIAP